MSDPDTPSAGSGRRAVSKARRTRRRRAVVRPTLTAVVLLAVYFVAPLDELDDMRSWLLLAGVFLAVGVVIVWQSMRILQSSAPVLQAAEALAVVVPLYLIGCSVMYYLMAAASPESFSETLSRMGSLYFTVTVFSTVGFGDILAVTDTTRAVVTIQMLANLFLLGIGGRIIFGAVERARASSHDPE